jgi:hypothetical protein
MDKKCYLCRKVETEANPCVNDVCICKRDVHYPCVDRLWKITGMCPRCKTVWNKPVSYRVYSNGLELIQNMVYKGLKTEFTINDNGEIHGKLYIYHENGVVKEEQTLENGLLHGVQKMRTKEGVLVREGEYSRGERIVDRYYKDGFLVMEKLGKN